MKGQVPYFFSREPETSALAEAASVGHQSGRSERLRHNPVPVFLRSGQLRKWAIGRTMLADRSASVADSSPGLARAAGLVFRVRHARSGARHRLSQPLRSWPAARFTRPECSVTG